MQTAQVREQMIEQQVRAWDVLDERVLEAMRRVPRELFVPATEAYRAYADAEVPLPCGQHMLRPSVVGRLLQGLLPQPHEQVLEVGAGSGFVTACLRGLAGGVRSLELYPQLAESARANLAALGVRGTEVLDADALRYESASTYDVIAVTASLPLYDARFERLLAVGGRLFVVVGQAPVMEARVVQRIASSEWLTRTLFETVIDPLVHAPQPAAFTF
ncbi:MAG TPA: protein-L-isoaspartate O-methyltransferase [Steroidobacteraceae bacterium]|nr:protein-L-isoaspartate O-methyltransferase [Steroidobacteraceae bacterium]